VSKDGKSCAELEDILMYTDDPSILSAFDNRNSSNFENNTKITNTNEMKSVNMFENVTSNYTNLSNTNVNSNHRVVSQHGQNDDIEALLTCLDNASFNDDLNLFSRVSHTHSTPHHNTNQISKVGWTNTKKSLEYHSDDDSHVRNLENDLLLFDSTQVKNKQNRVREVSVRKWGQ
jgi:hypothetical protein